MSTRVRMERVRGTDTKISLDDNAEKISSGLIECSVNMNVSLSNAKRSKIFQRTQSLAMVILAVVFAVLCFHLKREVRALEVQMNCVNSNLMMLMLRYEKLNKNFNRIWYHRVGNHDRWEELNTSSKSNAGVSIDGHGSPSRESEISRIESRTKNSTTMTKGPQRLNATFIEAVRALDKGLSRRIVADNEIENTRFNDDVVKREDASNADRDRFERAIVAFEKRNHQTMTALPSRRDDDSIDDAETWTENRVGRSRRDDGRGKKRRKVKRRLKSSRRRLGPLVATFVGGIPEQHVTDTVYVGPWVKSTRNESRYAFNKFHLVEDKKSIEVTANGLYMISAQIYYYGEPTHYSYWILLSSEGTSDTQRVIKCATVGAVSATEASCYTSVVLPLRKGDRLHIQQQERERLINLREGHSYVQIVLLSGESPRRRQS